MGVRPTSLFSTRIRRFPALTPKASETPTPHIWKLLANVATRMTDLAKVLVGLWLFFLTVLIAFEVRSHWSRSVITISPIDVTKGLEDEGFTGHVISDLLRKDLNDIHDSADSLVHSGSLGPSVPDDSPLLGEILLRQASLPGTGVSIDTVTEFILEALGRSPVTRISGSLRSTKQSTGLMLRMDHRPEIIVQSPRGEPCTVDCVDSLIQRAAEQAYRGIDPFALAAYYYDHYSKNKFDHDDFSLCEATIRYCLVNDPSTDDAVAYNLWGLLDESRGDLRGAQNKFCRALNRLKVSDPNPRLAAIVYSNWGALLGAMHQFDLGRQKFAKAMTVDRHCTYALYNWGWAWQAEKNYDEAEAKYRDVIRIDPSFLAAYHNLAYIMIQRSRLDDVAKVYADMEHAAKYRDPWVYANWGILLNNQGRYREAIEKCDRALDLDPTYAEGQIVKDYSSSMLKSLASNR
jgi:Tfp pilus assembly protein PilF